MEKYYTVLHVGHYSRHWRNWNPADLLKSMMTFLICYCFDFCLQSFVVFVVFEYCSTVLSSTTVCIRIVLIINLKKNPSSSFSCHSGLRLPGAEHCPRRPPSFKHLLSAARAGAPSWGRRGGAGAGLFDQAGPQLFSTPCRQWGRRGQSRGGESGGGAGWSSQQWVCHG